MTETGQSVASPAPPIENDAPSSRKWLRPVILAVAVVFFIAVVLAFLWRKAPPLAARLLPESDAIVYFNAGPLRTVTRWDAHPVKLDPEYRQFVDATGIQFERDLNEAAFALHRMANPLGPNGPVAFSSIFVGKFDRTRLSGYLDHIAQSKEQYAGHDIYNIPVEGRMDRVAILASDAVAVSNTPTAEQIHSIVDRNRTAIFLPFTGNTLIAQRYTEVPAFSLAWGLGKLGVGLGNDFTILGFRLPISVDATFIASLRWAGALHLKVEEIAPNDTAAAVSAQSLQALLGIFKTAQNVLPNSVVGSDTGELLKSVEVEQHHDRAIVSATIPLSLLQKLTARPDGQAESP